MERRSAAQGDLGLSLFRLAKLEEVEGAHIVQYTGTARQCNQVRWQRVVQNDRRMGVDSLQLNGCPV